jgi:hypothetical protein
MKARAEAVRKKPYQAPRLLMYGSLTEMTAGKGASNFDNPGKDTIHKT